jgi:membrane-bound ClpP family serine protease
MYAGQYAWISLLLVGVVLFYLEKYMMVVGALPLNGGAYNVLLNTSSKD